MGLFSAASDWRKRVKPFSAVSEWFKHHLLGTALFAVITGVAGNFLYDAVKPRDRDPTGTTVDVADLNQRKAQLRTDIRDTFDEWKYSAQMMRCYVDALRLPVNTAGHTDKEISASREAFYTKVGDISKYNSNEVSALEEHVRQTRREFDATMKETLKNMRKEATAELLAQIDRVCHHGASGK